MRRKTLSVMTAVTATALVLAACGNGDTDTDNDTDVADDNGGASDGATMRLAINQTEAYPSTIALNNFGESIAEATDGRWAVDVYPNEQLGAQAETLQLVADGAVDLAVVAGPQLENLNPDFVVFNMPTIFDDDAHEMRVVNDPEITEELYTSLEDQSITVVGGFTAGMRGVYTVEGPIETPEDLNGMQIRVQESPTMLRMVELMGGTPTPMAFGEVYTALQSGVIDGAENAEPSYVTQGHYEVAQHFSYTNHLINSDFLIINTDLLNSMSEEDQEIFRAEWENFTEDFMSLWQDSIDDSIAQAEEAGTIFTTPDQEAFTAALEPIVDETLQNDFQRELYEAARAAAE